MSFSSSALILQEIFFVKFLITLDADRNSMLLFSIEMRVNIVGEIIDQDLLAATLQSVEEQGFEDWITFRQFIQANIVQVSLLCLIQDVVLLIYLQEIDSV